VPQVFPRVANTLARLSLVGLVLFLGIFAVAAFAIYRSPFVTEVNVAKEQPIPFSHLRHVAGNGIDCRYCHTSVEDSSFAGIPPTETCMSCHSQILADQPIFDPLYTSWETGERIEWSRIHDVPDFVYFDHSIHLAKGVGCESCHGRVDKMALTWKVETLHMQWCLECHRQPEKFLRPLDEVYTMGYEPDGDQLAIGAALVEKLNVRKDQLTNCSVCHR
jgi:hypothetical protein